MECQWKSERYAAYGPTHFKYIHACHHDGQRRDDKHHPGILFFYTHADLRVRQCDRNDCYKDDINFRFMDAAYIPGIADPQQHQRHLYTDLFLRQCHRDNCHQDDVYFRFLDTPHISGIADSQQCQRHMYADLLHL